MFLSTIASWGNAKDRPQRDAMRALLIGRHFMSAYRQAASSGNRNQLSRYFDWVRKDTAPELRWMWSSDRAYQEEDTDAYVQVAGDLILGAVARADLLSDDWFRPDVDFKYGWLFEPACLKYDGWKLVDVQTTNSMTVKSWTNPKLRLPI